MKQLTANKVFWKNNHWGKKCHRQQYQWQDNTPHLSSYSGDLDISRHCMGGFALLYWYALLFFPFFWSMKFLFNHAHTLMNIMLIILDYFYHYTQHWAIGRLLDLFLLSICKYYEIFVLLCTIQVSISIHYLHIDNLPSAVTLPLVSMFDLSFMALYTTAADSLHVAKDVTTDTNTHMHALAYTRAFVRTQ